MTEFNRVRYEDRWGPIGAVAYRWIIPAGIAGLIALLLPVIWSVGFWLFLAYPLLVVAIALCGVRSVMLAKGHAKWLAASGGAALTALAALLAFGFWIGSSGI